MEDQRSCFGQLARINIIIVVFILIPIIVVLIGLGRITPFRTVSPEYVPFIVGVVFILLFLSVVSYLWEQTGIPRKIRHGMAKTSRSVLFESSPITTFAL